MTKLQQSSIVPSGPNLWAHLDSTIQQQHLVHEEVAEDTGAVDNNIHTGAAEFLKRDDLQLIHTAKRIRYGPDANHHHNL